MTDTRSAPAPTPASPVEELIEAPLSLRERKKLKTRQALRREAFRLFAEQGYENTTVDQIAAAAEVSPSTFFRYFATKEDLVLTDEYDPVMISALMARPADEPLLVSGRTVLVGLLRRIVERDRDELLVRMRLALAVPALRARMTESSAQPKQMILDVMTERAGLDAPTLEMRITAAAFTAALVETALYWAEQDGREDIADLLDHALEVLGNGLAA
ncbi:TetR family transcriptional regulator [Kitasatospora sp. NBC_00374]|uniref:acyl-CoA-like ligand-binding transcription factor n=1 Tax=Kitasatospora sp. NBC_00374 TaxID=2975964 RepID=UPI0030E18C1F